MPGIVQVEASTDNPVANTDRKATPRTAALRMVECSQPVMRKWAADPLMTEPTKPSDAQPSPPGDVTRLLIAWNEGDTDALERLVPLVYGELNRQARGYLRNERCGHTLQPTALVHEAYLKLVDQRRL